MLIAFISLINGTSPGTCMMKALAAFLVFAGFGLILRFALSEAQVRSDDDESASLLPARSHQGQLDVILPGTSVADLLGVDGSQDAEEAA